MKEDPPDIVTDAPKSVGYAARCGFAFLLLYLLLYSLPFPISQMPGLDDSWPVEAAVVEVIDWFGDPPEKPPHWAGYPGEWQREYTEEHDAAVTWFGENVLGVAKVAKVVPSGSGDTMFDWVRAALVLVLAVLACPVLALLLRGRRSLGICQRGLRIFVRYGVASTMCVYGFVKLFPLQFPALGAERLYGTYGDASPMNMLWSFMGASEPYTILSGFAEVLGGVLLLFRRTATAGALLSFAVMTNVLLLNLCYDVPVKLYSLHMVLFAAFLLAPDAPRLWSLFFGHTAIPAVQLRPKMPGWVLGGWFFLKLSAGAIVVGVPLVTSWQRWDEVQNRQPGPLEGIWEVREFTGDVPPPEHWHNLSIRYQVWEGETYSRAVLRHLSRHSIDGRIAVEAGTLKLQPFDLEQPAIELDYEERSQLVEGSEQPARQLVLTGTVDGKAVRAVCHYRDPSTFRLNRTGFRWIQERPDNSNGR